MSIFLKLKDRQTKTIIKSWFIKLTSGIYSEKNQKIELLPETKSNVKNGNFCPLKWTVTLTFASILIDLTVQIPLNQIFLF